MRGYMGNFGVSYTEDQEYVVQPGDSLSKISMKYYGDYNHVEEIADANGIVNVNLISVGQVLRIPLGEGTIDVRPLPMPSPPLVPIKPGPVAPPQTQPVTPPVSTLPVTPAPGTTIPSTPGSSFDIWSYMPTAGQKYAGLTVKQWGLAALVVAGLGTLFAARSRLTMANPRRRRRR